MHLKKIKLAGFKSFVDPTVINLPSNLVAVVGPNGCGKSNIIDAVTWVMGESSAKYLRGESLTDVIFNGSTSRKPIGQASVELVFDNQDGSIGGEYASYAEISIRRVITRDADSTYFLNGARCRRRDITDIFLGTGLGPRSYSIIGQNMISRIIEARPEDMRVYLEEAAGVSKYKERRRETENRIQHTKDNLARLDDVRNELEKQLGSLKRQAASAEKFKLLKQEERVKKAEWHAIEWRELDTRLVDYTLKIQQQETALEAHQTEHGSIDLAIEQKRNDQRLSNELYQEIQKRYYAAGNEVTRLEQEIRYHQEKQRQWQMDLDQVEKNEAENQENLHEIEAELEELATEISELTPKSEIANQAASEAVDDLASAEEALQAWQTRWDEFNQRASKLTQTAEVEQTRIQHLEQKLASIKERSLRLDQEKNQIDFNELENQIVEISEQASSASLQVTEHRTSLTDIAAEISSVRASQQQTITELDRVRNDIQRLHGEQSSLAALQQTALGQRNNRVVEWLEKHELASLPRLAQGVTVESGWEYAVEKVLGSYLQAVCVDKIVDLVDKMPEFKEGALCFYSGKMKSTHTFKKAQVLLEKITSKWPLESILSGIYIAESESEALNLVESLEPHESVITRSGVWMSSSWMRVTRDENPESGVFQREQELKQLENQIAEQTAKREMLEEMLEQTREQLRTLESQRDELQNTANQTEVQSAELRAQQKSKQERLNELKARLQKFQAEYDESLIQLENTEAELQQAKSIWQQALSDLEQVSSQRIALTEERDSSRENLQSARQRANQLKDEAHQLEIRYQTSQSQHASLQQTIMRMQSQLATLAARKETLKNELASAMQLSEIEQTLSLALNQRLQIENELNEARRTVELIEQELRSHETRRQEVERDLSRVRDVLESLRLESRELKVKSDNMIEQVKETGFLLEDILKALPAEAMAEEWQATVEQIAQRIARLGAINLVAIEEFASCSERKEYLDKQYADLQEGLATLESAIQKIDKETRAKFKETFDTVNEHFQSLFPKIFGGGRAYLELTGENLLDSGITVMACPPGKRNSTIHLLSGGEKAMTAIALIFSIFHLNPAPFCLLDEVDAPLDDANIGRYCHLVKSMSEKTQFIFISHNKLAIEMGEHLMGVTMHEPGVSRLVSVDVKGAIELAGV